MTPKKTWISWRGPGDSAQKRAFKWELSTVTGGLSRLQNLASIEYIYRAEDLYWGQKNTRTLLFCMHYYFLIHFGAKARQQIFPRYRLIIVFASTKDSNTKTYTHTERALHHNKPSEKIIHCTLTLPRESSSIYPTPHTPKLCLVSYFFHVVCVVGGGYQYPPLYSYVFSRTTTRTIVVVVFCCCLLLLFVCCDSQAIVKG